MSALSYRRRMLLALLLVLPGGCTSGNPVPTASPEGAGGVTGRVVFQGGSPAPIRTVTLIGPDARTAGDAESTPATGPSITVRVHDAETGQPVPGLTVRWRESSPTDRTAGVTDAQGEVRFPVQPRRGAMTGTAPLQVSAEVDVPPGYTPAVEAAPGYSFSHDFHLLPRQNAVWDVKTYRADGDAQLVVWRGVVLGPDGQPVPGAQVHIARRWLGDTKFLTDAQGRFSWRTQRLGLQEGDLEVTAAKADLSADQSLTPDETWGGIVVRLKDAPLAAMAGTVVDDAGRPLADVPLGLAARLRVPADNPRTTDTQATTDAQGAFQFTGLSPDAYYSLRCGGWPSPFGVTWRPTAAEQTGHSFPTSLTLRPGERRDLGRIVVLRAYGTLSGRVTDTEGRAVTQSLQIWIVGAHTQVYTSSNAGGTFQATPLVAEPLTLTLHSGGANQSVLATLHVRVGQRNIRVVIPASSWTQPPPPPAATPPVPMPSVPMPPPSALHLGAPSMGPAAGTFDLYGLHGQYDEGGNVTLHDLQGDIIWQGTLADMDKVSLALNGNRGTLQSASGGTLWAGAVSNVPELRIIMDQPPQVKTGQFVTVQDAHGHRLWSGLIAGYYYPLLSFTADRVTILGPDNRPAWTGLYRGGVVAFRRLGGDTDLPFSAQTFLPNAWEYGPPPAGFQHPLGIKGVAHVSPITRRAELQDTSGKVLWSGPVTLLTQTLPKGTDEDDFVLLDKVNNLNGTVRCVILRADGTPMPEYTMYSYTPPGR